MENLQKTKEKYLKLLMSTNITGVYNFYLNKNYKALRMGLVLIISIILLFTGLSILSSLFTGLGILGLVSNIIVFLNDLIKYKKDMQLYNDGFNIKKDLKDVGIYKKNTLVFGLLGIQNVYLGNYKLPIIRFFIPIIILDMAIIFGIAILVMSVIIPTDLQQGAGWFIIIVMWIVMASVMPIIIIVCCMVPIIFIINIVKSINSFINADYYVDECNEKLINIEKSSI